MTKTPSRLTLEVDLRDQIGRHRVYSLVALCVEGPVKIDVLLAVAHREFTDGEGQARFTQEVLRRSPSALMVPALRRTRTDLRRNHALAHENGVPPDRLMRIAVAAFDCGINNALQGWREQADPDLYASGGDYSADVFRRATEIREILHGDSWGLRTAALHSALR